jgi:formate dehydrogenase accessory protein FdhE
VKLVTEQQILKALADWEQNKGSLPPILTLYRQLMRIQSEARAEIEPYALEVNRAAVKARLNMGQPLLKFEDLPINWTHFQRLFKEASSIFTDYLELEKGILEPFGDITTLKSLVEDWYQGQVLDTYTENPGALGLVVQAALKPFLNVAGEVLLPSINQEQWLRSTCPVCGGVPDFSFLDKERGARYLICSRCDTEWLFKRMECPFCGNQDQTKLAYFISDTGLYRLYICEKCKNYLKAIDLRTTEKQVIMPLERFITLDLDEQACRHGYSVYTSGRGDAKQPIGSN